MNRYGIGPLAREMRVRRTGNLIARGKLPCLAAFDIPLSWGELLKRTAKETSEDDCFGLAAQLAYYFFLALFPAVLFVLALASFFPLTNFIDDVVRTLRPVAPGEVLNVLEEQLRRISNADSGGILTIGILGAIWSSSAALVAIVSSLNRAYDIEESRPWWKVRLTAVGLTVALALLVSPRSPWSSLVPPSPSISRRRSGRARCSSGRGRFCNGRSRSSWCRWLSGCVLLCARRRAGLDMDYAGGGDWHAAMDGHFAWRSVITSRTSRITTLRTEPSAELLFFCCGSTSPGLAILVGAELNAEIEHASPHGKDPGEKLPGKEKDRRRCGASIQGTARTAIGTARTAGRQQPSPATPSPADRKWGLVLRIDDARNASGWHRHKAEPRAALTECVNRG